MEGDQEVLDQEPRRPPPRWVWVSLVALLVIAGAGWGLDELQRGREDDALTHCRAQLRLADQSASTRLGRVADYLRSSLAALPPDQAYRLAEPMTSPARLAIPGVRAAVETCHDVSVWAWHEPSHSTRAATVAYADQLLARLQRIAAEGGAYFDADAQLDRLRAAARLS